MSSRRRILSFLIIGLFTFVAGILLFNWMIGAGVPKILAKGIQLVFIIEVSYPFYWAWTWKDRQHLTTYWKAFWRFQGTRVLNLAAGWIAFLVFDLVLPTGVADIFSILLMAFLNFRTGDAYVFNSSKLPIEAYTSWFR